MKGRSDAYRARRKAGAPYHDSAEVAISPWDGKPIPVAELIPVDSDGNAVWLCKDHKTLMKRTEECPLCRHSLKERPNGP